MGGPLLIKGDNDENDPDDEDKDGPSGRRALCDSGCPWGYYGFCTNHARCEFSKPKCSDCEWPLATPTSKRDRGNAPRTLAIALLTPLRLRLLRITRTGLASKIWSEGGTTCHKIERRTWGKWTHCVSSCLNQWHYNTIQHYGIHLKRRAVAYSINSGDKYSMHACIQLRLTKRR